MKINFAGQVFETRCARTLYWPAEKALIVSDLHLEKGSSFALRGFFVPPYDSRDTLHRLAQEIDLVKPEKIIFLGDSFHDEKSYQRLNDKDRQGFQNIVESHEILWITGNHEGKYRPADIVAHHEFKMRGIMFRHEAAGAGFEITGHYHPAASVSHKGHRVRKPCFFISQKIIIMPSFGSYTGGLDVTDPVFSAFQGQEFHAYLCGKDRIFKIGTDLLAV